MSSGYGDTAPLNRESDLEQGSDSETEDLDDAGCCNPYPGGFLNCGRFDGVKVNRYYVNTPDEKFVDSCDPFGFATEDQTKVVGLRFWHWKDDQFLPVHGSCIPWQQQISGIEDEADKDNAASLRLPPTIVNEAGGMLTWGDFVRVTPIESEESLADKTKKKVGTLYLPKYVKIGNDKQIVLRAKRVPWLIPNTRDHERWVKYPTIMAICKYVGPACLAAFCMLIQNTLLKFGTYFYVHKMLQFDDLHWKPCPSQASNFTAVLLDSFDQYIEQKDPGLANMVQAKALNFQKTFVEHRNAGHLPGDNCQCMEKWTYALNGATSTHHWCSSTPDYPQHDWCYVEVTPQCTGQQASLNLDESRKWRACEVSENPISSESAERMSFRDMMTDFAGVLGDKVQKSKEPIQSLEPIDMTFGTSPSEKSFGSLQDPVAGMFGYSHVDIKFLDMLALLFPLLFTVVAVLTDSLGVWTKIMLCMSVLAVGKGIFGAITTVPDSNGWGACQARLEQAGGTGVNLIDYYKQDHSPFDFILGPSIMTRYCADMMYSGHTYFVTIFALGLFELTRNYVRANSLFTSNMAQCLVASFAIGQQIMEIYFVLRSRFHYSMDVVMALLLTFLWYTNGMIVVVAKWWVHWRPPLSLCGLSCCETEEESDVKSRKFTFMRAINGKQSFRRWVWAMQTDGEMFVPTCCGVCCIKPFCTHRRQYIYSDDDVYDIMRLASITTSQWKDAHPYKMTRHDVKNISMNLKMDLPTRNRVGWNNGKFQWGERTYATPHHLHSWGPDFLEHSSAPDFDKMVFGSGLEDALGVKERHVVQPCNSTQRNFLGGTRDCKYVKHGHELLRQVNNPSKADDDDDGSVEDLDDFCLLTKFEADELKEGPNGHLAANLTPGGGHLVQRRSGEPVNYSAPVTVPQQAQMMYAAPAFHLSSH